MNKLNKRLVGAAAVGAAMVVGMSSVAATADAAPVPGGSKTKKLVDGTPVTIQLFDQKASVQRPMTNVPTSREVWVSGKVRVTVGGSAQGGSINVGYEVGCQVNFGAGAGTEGSVDFEGNPSGSSSAGITLGPGRSGFVPLIQDEDSDDDAVNAFFFVGNKGGAAYGQESFRVDGCAGHASARPVISVTVNTDAVKGIVTYVGKPFSLG